MDRPSWAFKDVAVIFKYYQDDTRRVFIIEGLDHHYDILSLFTGRDFLLVSIPCHTTEWNFRFARQCLESQNPSYPLTNITFLANTKEQVAHASSNGFQSIFFNQNALLDEETYWLERHTDRTFSLVLNTRPERNFKRPYLAGLVDSLAIIQGYNFRKDDYMDLQELNPSFLNRSRLTIQEVVGIYNQSLVGGIFSEKEGACYSSSEYLLCGLPVISTHSEGGRDVWYNKFNSVICAPTEDAVHEAVSLVKHRLADGTYNRNRIRSMHILMQHDMRDSLCLYTAHLCDISESFSSRLLYTHLKSTNKLQQKIKFELVEQYINAS